MNQPIKTTVVLIISLLIASVAFTAALEASGIVFRMVAGFIALIAVFFFPLYVILRKPEEPANRTASKGSASSSRSLARTGDASRSSSSSSSDSGLIYAGAASAGSCSSSASPSSCSGSSDGGGGGGD